jgi:hypothetical protein
MSAVRSGIVSRAVALTSAALSAAAILCAGQASADPSPQEQQDQFVALLEADQVPMIDNLPALVARAHQICKELNSGTSVYAVVDEEMNGIFDDDPSLRAQTARVHRTAIRFIAVSSEVYCPSHLTDPYVSNDVGFLTRGASAGIPQPT